MKDFNYYVARINHRKTIEECRTMCQYDEEAAQEMYAKLYSEYETQKQKKHEEFKNDCFVEFDIVDNPKAEKLYAIAWDKGHAYGYSEVFAHMSELVELIK